MSVRASRLVAVRGTTLCEPEREFSSQTQRPAAGRCPWPSLRLTDGPSPLPHQVLLGQMEDMAETQLTAIELPEFQV